MDIRQVERASAVLQHLDQTRLVEGRIGVRRTREARHPSGHSRVHFGFERGLVFEARLAQPRGQIDESGADDKSARVDRAFRCPARRRRAHRNHLAPGNVDRRDAVDAVFGVDHAAVADLDLHPSAGNRRGEDGAHVVSSPRECSTRPSAPRCRTSPAAGSRCARHRRPPTRFRRHGSSALDA